MLLYKNTYYSSADDLKYMYFFKDFIKGEVSQQHEQGAPPPAHKRINPDRLVTKIPLESWQQIMRLHQLGNLSVS